MQAVNFTECFQRQHRDNWTNFGLELQLLAQRSFAVNNLLLPSKSKALGCLVRDIKRVSRLRKKLETRRAKVFKLYYSKIRNSTIKTETTRIYNKIIERTLLIKILH